MDILALSQLAIKAARSAGQVIQQHLHTDLKVEVKDTATSYAAQVVTAVDRACESAIFAHLLPSCTDFDIALLSEETEDDGSRFQKDYFWCIDPLDGTLAFIQQRPGFSVSIALVARDGSPQIGVVLDPSTNTLYHAIKGLGAYRNDRPWQPQSDNTYLTYVTDRKLQDTPRVSEIEAILQAQMTRLQLGELKEMAGGGSVLNAIRVLENGPACLLKFPKKEKGGGSLWDFAATACIFQEIGLAATSFEGGKLDLNKAENTFMNEKGVFFANW